MAAGLSPFNRALGKIPRRAEQRDTSALRETFVDSGVAEVLDMVDHQVLYGRRGTGKTHAVAYLASEARTRGDVALYLDLRTVGSPDGVLDAESSSLADRATRLLVDMLGQVRDGLMDAVIEDEDLIEDAAFVDKLDGLLTAITNVQLSGEVELSVEAERKGSEKGGGSLKVAATPKPSIEAQLTAESAREGRDLLRETRRGTERISLNFSDVARALRELARTLSSRRVWLVFDEWSSVPRDVQPYLAEFLVRCVLPLQGFTVKITAIEQQSSFRATASDGSAIGIELGADVGAHIDLDEFLVFEQNEEQARAFFTSLFFKHLTSGADEEIRLEGLNQPADVIRLGFTDTRAFDELVRAAEGVPRDAIYIAAKAAMHAGTGKISVPLIRSSARSWYQTDKAGALRSREQSQELLKWIIDKVIREKRARGFLVNERYARDPLLLALFDARVLHIVRRGYSAQDQPGERFDVWVIDYGAYIDLIQTKNAPQGLLPFGDEDSDQYVNHDVPVQDLRAIRRAILALNEFYAAVDPVPF
jgi:hypothetical protein